MDLLSTRLLLNHSTKDDVPHSDQQPSMDHLRARTERITALLLEKAGRVEYAGTRHSAGWPSPQVPMARFRSLCWLAVVAVAGGCEDQSTTTESDMGLFSRKVSLQDQLARMAELGITRNEGTKEEDLFTFHDREELEAKPYKALAETMGIDIEREPWTPISDRLWMCDFERIEDHGDYRSVVDRLERMTGSALSLTNVEDYVDLEEGVAWVQFDHAGRKVRWDFEVDDDWLDPKVLTDYAGLLARSNSPLRLFEEMSGVYGQVAFLAAFTPEHQKQFQRLTGIKMQRLD